MSSLRQIIHDPDENVPDEEEREPEIELTSQERRWYALGAMKSALLIGCVYVVAFAIIIMLMLLFWT